MKSGDMVKTGVYPGRGLMIGIIIDCNNHEGTTTVPTRMSEMTYGILWSSGAYEDYIHTKWLSVLL